jgi:hypothetical protein
MARGRNFEAFLQGTGVQPTEYCCADCGYTSNNRKHFKSSGDEGQKTCATGHFEDKEGQLKRARNPYAARR